MKLIKQDVGVWVSASDHLPTKEKVIFRFAHLPEIEINGYYARFGKWESLNFSANIFGTHYAPTYNDRIEWIKPVKDVFVLTESDILNIFEAGEKRGLSYIDGHGYDDDKDDFDHFIKSITK